MRKNGRSKTILFLSGVDFKEKSIQVIRKTPEAYVQAGWEVHYVVGRDTSKLGDYFYENVINPPGVHIYRFSIPLAKLHGLVNNVVWKAVWFRVRNLLLVQRLAVHAIRLLKSRAFDVVYGYEIPGVLAVRLIRSLGYGRECKFVTRFQGVLYVKEWLRTGKKFRFVSNFEAILSLRTSADLCIMTNDGSQGTEILRKLKSPVRKVLFLSNGVDEFEFDAASLNEVRKQYYNQGGVFYFLSVSRLDNHKRVDRGLRIVHYLVHKLDFKNLVYTIVGGGADFEKLQRLVTSLDLERHVRFLGPINHDAVKYHYHCSDFFISMYTSTNVGNPLLEAIRSNNLIVTLDNGDTGQWISHRTNGLIYPVNDDRDLEASDYETIAKEISVVLRNTELKKRLKEGIAKTEREKLWTWQERMQAEVNAVEELFSKK